MSSCQEGTSQCLVEGDGSSSDSSAAGAGASGGGCSLKARSWRARPRPRRRRGRSSAADSSAGGGADGAAASGAVSSAAVTVAGALPRPSAGADRRPRRRRGRFGAASPAPTADSPSPDAAVASAAAPAVSTPGSSAGCAAVTLSDRGVSAAGALSLGARLGGGSGSGGRPNSIARERQCSSREVSVFSLMGSVTGTHRSVFLFPFYRKVSPGAVSSGRGWGRFPIEDDRGWAPVASEPGPRRNPEGHPPQPLTLASGDSTVYSDATCRGRVSEVEVVRGRAPRGPLPGWHVAVARAARRSPTNHWTRPSTRNMPCD